MELEIRGLSKSYGSNKALDQLSAGFTKGIYGLLGPNGAGKSTLMNIICGSLHSDEGSILYDGQNILEMGKEFRSILGYMPQQQGLYEQFTGYHFLSYIAALKGMDKKAAKKEVEQAAAFVNLSNELNTRLGAYSGGMKQRILIAQAVLNNPSILILDEPTVGLDPKERIRIRNLISQIAIDKIVVIATHVVQDIESIAKEVLLLKKGKLLEKDTPANILRGMEHTVYEIIAEAERLPEIEAAYSVCNITMEYDKLAVRVLADEPPVPYTYRQVNPTLEDKYLYTFADEVVHHADT